MLYFLFGWLLSSWYNHCTILGVFHNNPTSIVLFSTRVWLCKIILYHTCTSCRCIDLRSWTRMWFLHERLVETNICTGNQRREVPGESGSFFMRFSIFFITSLSPVSCYVMLWFQKSISLAALLLSVQLILYPTILLPWFFLCLSSHISVHIAIFPGYPKCDSTVHFSTLFGSVIRHHLHPRPSKEKLFHHLW